MFSLSMQFAFLCHVVLVCVAKVIQYATSLDEDAAGGGGGCDWTRSLVLHSRRIPFDNLKDGK